MIYLMRMDCPKCGHVQADGPAECAKCGLIFARWVERRSTGPVRPRPSPPLDEPEGAKASPLALLLGCTTVLFLALACWHLWFGGGLPMDRDAYRDSGAGFALVIPAGWTLVTPANAGAVLAQVAGRYPEAVDQALEGGRTVAALFLPHEPGALGPWGTVMLSDGVPPTLRDEDRALLAAEAYGALAKRFTGYRPGEAAVVPVDRLAALRVTGADEVKYLRSPSQEVYGELPGGRRYPLGRTEDIWATFDRSLEHWLVPGSDRSFLLTFGCPEESAALHAPAFAAVVDSFRVHKRPPRYGPILTPALRALATVLLAAAMIYTLTEAAAFLKRR